jgi:hypothetical protein
MACSKAGSALARRMGGMIDKTPLEEAANKAARDRWQRCCRNLACSSPFPRPGPQPAPRDAPPPWCGAGYALDCETWRQHGGAKPPRHLGCHEHTRRRRRYQPGQPAVGVAGVQEGRRRCSSPGRKTSHTTIGAPCISNRQRRAEKLATISPS